MDRHKMEEAAGKFIRSLVHPLHIAESILGILNWHKLQVLDMLCVFCLSLLLMTPSDKAYQGDAGWSFTAQATLYQKATLLSEKLQVRDAMENLYIWRPDRFWWLREDSEFNFGTHK